MSILGKVWNTFRNFIGGISGIWCIIIIAALDIQIFCRTFLGFSTTWSEEVAELCFVGLIFCYLAQCEKEGAHLQLEILFQIWPKLKFYMDVAGKSICIIYCAFVIYSESLLIPTTMKLTTAACHIPIRYVHYLIVLGSAMWIIQEMLSLYEIFKERRAQKCMNMILLLIGFVGLLAVGAPIVVARACPRLSTILYRGLRFHW